MAKHKKKRSDSRFQPTVPIPTELESAVRDRLPAEVREACNKYGITPGWYLVNQFPIARRKQDGLIEIHKITEYTAVFSFFCETGSVIALGTAPKNLAKYVIADHRISGLLTADLEAEYSAADLPKRKRLASAVARAIKMSDSFGNLLPHELLALKRLSERCLARCSAEEDDDKVFPDPFD